MLQSFLAVKADAANEDAIVASEPLAILSANVTALIEAMRTSERVAVALAASAAQLPRRHVREVAEVSWDRASESELSVAVEANPDEEWRYTTSALDRARPLAEQQRIAEQTVSSQRYLSVMRNISDIVRWQRVGIDAA